MKQQVYAAIAAVFIGLGLGVATSNYGRYPTYRLPEVTLPDGVIENISMFTAIIFQSM